MSFMIGTSGWSYQQWKDQFYPMHFKQQQWLQYYSRYFNTIEVNNTYYRLPSFDVIRRWIQETPAEFIFAIKAYGLITHKKRLQGCEEELQYFLSICRAFDNKLGPILFQLPPSFHINLATLEAFLKLLPADYRYSFEFRHPSWWQQSVYQLLEDFNVSFCIFQLGQLQSPLLTTANFIYIRLHGYEAPYLGSYSEHQLTFWQQWIQQKKQDSYIYFDNTAHGIDAIINGLQLQRKLELK